MTAKSDNKSVLDSNTKGYIVHMTAKNLKGVYDKNVMVALSDEVLAVFIAKKNLRKTGDGTFSAYINSEWELSVSNKEKSNNVVSGAQFLETAVELGYKVEKSDFFSQLF